MREGKCGSLVWELLTFVVYDSRMLPPQSKSLTLSQLNWVSTFDSCCPISETFPAPQLRLSRAICSEEVCREAVASKVQMFGRFAGPKDAFMGNEATERG